MDKNLLMIETLGKTTANREIIPESWEESNGVLKGNRGGVHTILCGVQIPSIKAEYERRVIDPKTGRNLIKPQEGECHSWVRNHYNHIVSSVCGINASDSTFGDGKINGKDTGGTVRYATAGFEQIISSIAPGENQGYAPTFGVSAWGIQLGTGTTAVDVDNDYVIETQIAHGTGAGQLYYATSPPDVYTYSGSTLTRIFSRYFDNGSGAQISPSEQTLVGYMRSGATNSNYLVSRDIISPAFDIPHLSQAKIQYTFTLDYSSPGNRLRNLYNMLFCQATGVNVNDSTYEAGKLSGLDTSNTVRYGAYPMTWTTTNLNTSGFGYARGAGSDVSGIVMGSNSTAVTFEDYTLNTLIAQGTGAGQLNYGATETPAGSWSDPVYTTQQARPAANGSGGDVTVRESGIIGRPRIGSDYNFMMVRNTFSDEVVANGESIRVVYHFLLTYP